MSTGALSLEVKSPVREAYASAPSSSEGKKAMRFTSTRTYALNTETAISFSTLISRRLSSIQSAV